MKGALLGATTRAPATRPIVKSGVYVKPTLAGAIANPGASARVTRRLEMGQTIESLNNIDKLVWNSGANPPVMDPAYPYPRLLCSAPDKMANGYSGSIGPSSNGAPPERRTAACNYINALLDEWARADMPAAIAPGAQNAPAGSTPASTGCFANDTACDWNPTDFMAGMDDLVMTQIENVQAGQMEADYKACRDFVRPATQSKWNPNGRMTQREWDFLGGVKSFLQDSYNQIKDTPVLEKGPNNANTSWAPKNGTDHYATFGEKRQNAENWGNSLFGVGYDYGIGWELPTEWEESNPGSGNFDHLCDFGMGAWGKFEAYAYAFGSDKFDIISARLGAGANDPINGVIPTTPNQGGFDAFLEIAGDELVPEKKVTVDFNKSQNITLAKGSNSWMLFEAPFQISFVTLFIMAGVGYEYGAEASFTPTHVNTCGQRKGAPSIGINAGIGPYGKLEAVVEAYASIAGLAGIGVEVELELLGIGLPVTANVDVKGPAGGTDMNKFTLDVGAGLNMDFHTLDGHLGIYAELLFMKLFDITILHWDGFHKTIPIFNTGTSLPLFSLQQLGNAGLMDPTQALKDL
jgi:hypothetical protein